MSSKIGHAIAQRDDPKDVFITPPELAKLNIDMIEFGDTEVWYDPFKNSGNYFNQFPNENKVWSEILEGRDFFKYNGHVDIICSNPPYSLMTPIIEKCIQLKPRVISFLIGMLNLTPKRIEDLNNAGYGLVKLRFLKIHEWFGNSFIVVFELGKGNCIEIDRTIYHDERIIQQKNEEKEKKRLEREARKNGLLKD